MPLSEEELRALEQIERAYAAEDPKFVSMLQGRTLRRVARLRTLGSRCRVPRWHRPADGWGRRRDCGGLGHLGFVVMLVRPWSALPPGAASRSPRSGPTADALFDFDDHPHRFEVLDGGRAGKPKRQRKPRRRKHAQPKHGTFMQRIEQRWQHRRDQGF